MLLNLLLSLISCASTWVYIDHENQVYKLNQVSVRLPNDWMIYNDHLNRYYAKVNGNDKMFSVDRLLMTKNGFELDAIDIMEIDRENAFPNIQKDAPTSILPSELADRFLAEQKVRLGFDRIEVIKNEPFRFSTTTGFRMDFDIPNTNGLHYKYSAAGFTTEKTFITFLFRAPTLHYYPNGSEEFDKLLASVNFSDRNVNN